MRFFLISDNLDTAMGMRLAGIEGVVVHEEDEVSSAIDKACADEDIGIILITDKLVALCKDKVYNLKLLGKRPLIVAIPDRHDTATATESIDTYVREAIGIKL